MTLNPFNWTAGPFLTLYLALAVIVFVWAFRQKSMIGPSAREPRRLSELELAFLAGGARRLGDAALLGLTSNRGATIDAKGRKITVTDQTPLASLMTRPPVLSFPTEMTRQKFQSAVEPIVERVRGRLETFGYYPTETQMTSFRMSVLPFVGLLLFFGATKAVVGAERNHPIGFLMLLMAITAVAAVGLASRPARTRAGNEALQSYRSSHARLARAPRDHELLLAVALSGPVVLSGTAYASVHAASQTMSSSSGGDGGGSGCGGGGGGGGCGGCS
jgi:uncharacterized protein (TIGR04222 family)